MFTTKKFITDRAFPCFLGIFGAGVSAAKGAPVHTAHLPGHRFSGMTVFESHTPADRTSRWTPVRALNFALFDDTLHGCVAFKNRLTGSDADSLELSSPVTLSTGQVNTVRIVDDLVHVHFEPKVGLATNARNGWSLSDADKALLVEAVFHTLDKLTAGRPDRRNIAHFGLPVAA